MLHHKMCTMTHMIRKDRPVSRRSHGELRMTTSVVSLHHLMANDGDAFISKCFVLQMKWRNLEKHVEIIEHSDLRATRVQSSELED